MECSSPPSNLDPVDKELYPLHNKMGTYSVEFVTMDAGDYRPLKKVERTTLTEIPSVYQIMNLWSQKAQVADRTNASCMFSYSLKTELLDKRLEECSSKDATLQVISRKNEEGREVENNGNSEGRVIALTLS